MLQKNIALADCQTTDRCFEILVKKTVYKRGDQSNLKEILLISPNFISTEKEFLLTYKIKKISAEIFPILLDVCAYARCLVEAGIYS